MSSCRCRAALLAGAASQGPSQGGHRGGCLTDRGGLADSVICRVVGHVADSLADNPAGVIGVVQDEPRAKVEVQESFLIPWCRSICVGLRRRGASQRRACWSVVVHWDRYSGVRACVPGLQRRSVLGYRGPLHVPADDGEGGGKAERCTDCTWRLRSCSTSVMSMHSGAVTNTHPGTVHHRGWGRVIEDGGPL